MTTPDPAMEAKRRKVSEILAARSDCDHIDASDIDEIIAKAWPLLHDAYKAEMRKVVPERTWMDYKNHYNGASIAFGFNEASCLILGEEE